MKHYNLQFLVVFRKTARLFQCWRLFLQISFHQISVSNHPDLSSTNLNWLVDELVCFRQSVKVDLKIHWPSAQGPHSQLLMTGGLTEVHILYPKKSLQNLSTQKKSLLFLAYAKKSLSPFLQLKKIPSFFFTTQNNPASFIDSKSSLLAKISDPKKITQTPPPPPPPSLKYVSGALGAISSSSIYDKTFRLECCN